MEWPGVVKAGATERLIGSAIKPDIRNHGLTQIEDADRHGFIREIFKSFVFICVNLCPSVVKNFIAGAINGIGIGKCSPR